MTFGHIHREQAPHVGDPADESLVDLLGIAPPCACGEEATVEIRGTDYCPSCRPDTA